MKYELRKCKVCGEPKPLVTHFKARIYSGSFYYSRTCAECEKAIRKQKYDLVKDTIVYKEKNRANVKRYVAENRELVRDKDRIRRQVPHAREIRKQYYEHNREKILADHRIVVKRSSAKERLHLKETYILNVLSSKLHLTRDTIREKAPELIKAYQKYISLKRLIKNHGKES